jgi:flagellar L-ring protein precursor FlgH
MSLRFPHLLVAVLCWLAATAAQAQSLYREDSWRGLTADNKAYRPGDVLTVQVFENTTAISSADTGTRRNNRLRAELAHGNSVAAEAALGVGSEFDGGGSTQRASRLLTTVSVVVQDVLPSGQLRIAGVQSVTVNQELQKVTLEGLVRPADISDGNVVQSTRIAEARITYVGEGDVTERGRRSWWRKLLDTVGF